MGQQKFNLSTIMISFLQVFGILLVVIGHSFHGYPDNLIFKWIHFFHMPLFMFLSGYLLEYTMKLKGNSLSTMSLNERGKFIVKKMKRLIVPYVVISSFAFFPKVLLSSFATRPLEYSLSSYCDMLIYPWKNAILYFWFLPTLFLIFCIVISGTCFLKYLNIKIPYLFILFLLALLHIYNPLEEISILNLGGAMRYMIYFAAGYYLCKQKSLTNPTITASVTFCLSICFIFLPSFYCKDLLAAFNGILMSISISQLYTKYNWHYFHSFFGASFAIYLFSWFPQVASQQIFLSVTHAPWQLGTCLAIISGFYVPLWIYKWIIKNKKRKIGKFVAILTGQ